MARHPPLADKACRCEMGTAAHSGNRAGTLEDFNRVSIVELLRRR